MGYYNTGSQGLWIKNGTIKIDAAGKDKSGPTKNGLQLKKWKKKV